MNAVLARRSLQVTRLSLIGFAIGLLGMIVASILLLPDYAVRHALEYTPNAFWTASETQAALAELDWPPISLAWYSASLGLSVTLVGLSFSLFLLWRKSDDWFGVYLALAFLVVSLDSTLFAPVLERVPILTGMLDLLGVVGWQLTFMLFYLFPDGRFVPRWTRWMPFVWLGVNLPGWLFSYSLMSAPVLGLWIGVGLVFTAVASQVYRYARRSSLLQRQQSKWVVTALVAMFAFVAVAGPATFRPPPAEALGRTLQWALLSGAIFRASFLVLPAAIMIGVLRYRLWDLDILIRRTLIYSTLTAVLALAYLGSVLVLESVFRAFTGQGQNSLVVVLSTLAIAALFGPLRSRVQRAIDRRFFRRKYDAARTLAGFAASARDETDLERLSAQLVGVVDQTMQPASVSLWLRTGRGAATSEGRGEPGRAELQPARTAAAGPVSGTRA